MNSRRGRHRARSVCGETLQQTHFRVATQAWMAQGEATSGPLKMKEYVPSGTTEAAAADQRATAALVMRSSTTRAGTITPSSLS
jgi:hypothetical protein